MVCSCTLYYYLLYYYLHALQQRVEPLLCLVRGRGRVTLRL